MTSYQDEGLIQTTTMEEYNQIKVKPNIPGDFKKKKKFKDKLSEIFWTPFSKFHERQTGIFGKRCDMQN